MPDLETPCARVESIVAEYLGRRTAESAVRISASTWVKREPAAVTASDLPALCSGLEPMLRTFLGAEVARSVLARIREVAR